MNHEWYKTGKRSVSRGADTVLYEVERWCLGCQRDDTNAVHSMSNKIEQWLVAGCSTSINPFVTRSM